MDPEDDVSPIELAFLERLLQDQARGAVRPAAEYQAMYPGHEAAIAHHLGRLRDADGRDAPSAGPAGPRRIDRYRLVRELGRGGQGVVYLAHDDKLGRRVALKVLTGLGAASEELLRRFRREAETASRLDHPGVCSVYDSGTHEGVPFIAMRYVEGEPLSRLISDDGDGEPTTAAASGRERSGAGEPGRRAGSPGSSTRAEVMATVELFEKIARALHAAHEAGVIHRDVKPGNVMVTPGGDPVVLDFGLARDLERDAPSLTRTGDVFGTPAYMSPEQLAADGTPCDHRTDVYSLGVSLYEAVTRARPFDSPTREGLYKKILTQPPRDPRHLNPAVPGDLRIILDTALEKSPDARYRTAADFAEDLRRLREHEPIRARAIGRGTRLLRWAQRNPALAASVVFAAVVLVVSSVVSTTFALRARDHLAEWERLADGRRLDDLVEEARGELWPVVPAKIGAYEAWLARAGALLGRLPEHRAALEALRQRAEPRTESAAQADRDSYVAENTRLDDIAHRLAWLREGGSELEAERDRIEDELERLEAAPAVTLEQKSRIRRRQERLDQVEASIDELEEARATIPELEREQQELAERVQLRRTWDFADDADQLRHDKLATLVSELERMRDDASPQPHDVTIAEMRRRYRLACALRDRLEGEDRDEWACCLADLGKGSILPPRAELRPVPGLVPLGKDRDSGLWEFWLPASGDRPAWDGEPAGTGRVKLDPDSGDDGIVLVLVPGGRSLVGAWHADRGRAEGSPHVDPRALAEEMPAQPVELDPFLMSKYEISQGQWLRMFAYNPSYLQAGGRGPTGLAITPRHPLTKVSWREAAEACRRWNLRLPTEAQWEVACRAGTTTAFHTGDDVPSLAGYANIGDASRIRSYALELQDDVDDGFVETAPVGSFKPNAWGLHDMHGNVAEWCLDGFHRYQNRPPRPGDGLRGTLINDLPRVARPGSYISVAFYSRASARLHMTPDHKGLATGFRPARRWPVRKPPE